MNLNARITKLLKNEFVDYIGFADLRLYQKEVFKFGGKIVEDYKFGISIGIVLPKSIVDYLPNRFDQNIACEYKTHAYSIINDRLDLCASKISSYLNKKGFRSLPIAVAERTNIDEAIPTISHKMIAHIAGLGWIGKNCLLITPENGPRVRFVTVLTNAPLNAMNNPLQQKCNDCIECVKICPAQAIKGKNYVEGESREERLDFIKCQNYFKKMKEKYTWDVCGMCLYVCPYGK
jgi:epoxyqueuosine reductase QueG